MNTNTTTTYLMGRLVILSGLQLFTAMGRGEQVIMYISIICSVRVVRVECVISFLEIKGGSNEKPENLKRRSGRNICTI